MTEPSSSAQGRRVLVAVVTGVIGERVQAWRDEHDPGQARRIPPHSTLAYWPPTVDGDGIAVEDAGPVISMTPAGAPAAHAPAAHAPAHGETAAVSTGASILLIEDEVTLRTAISRFLRTSGYRVVSAESGSAALDVITTQRFDLILLDLRMTGVTGEDVYESMQNSHPDQAAKVVFMTGDLHSTHAARFIRQTGRPVLAKPFTLSELAARVAQLVPA